MPLISICIPAYKRTDYLQRLLTSLVTQTFRDFEVVITDDSNDTSVQWLLQQYENILPVVYQKNDTALGTPANWNAAIKLAKGEWIKLMHDDDWFAAPQALQEMADAAGKGQPFVFCAYTSYELSSGAKTIHTLSEEDLELLQLDPQVLFAKNTIGPPSVTLVHRSVAETYDERMKWMVDFDFYIRALVGRGFTYIHESLVYIGVSAAQVTVTAFRNPAIEIPEAWMILDKYGLAPLKNIRVYDAWWRLMRNLGIRTTGELAAYAPGKEWPAVITRLLQQQSRWPLSLLRIGVVSKSLMYLSYKRNKKLLKTTSR